MKTLAKFFCLFLFFSCSEQQKPRDISKIQIQKFPIDSVSIRAIYATDTSHVFFAGSNGRFGTVMSDGTILGHTFRYQDSITPSFRSLASNANDLFTLSIGNPALLYKISKDTTTLVYKEFHEKVFYDSMQFFDANNGIAMGDPTEDCLSIILTKDGGKTWNKIPCNQLPKTIEGEAAFAASNTNIKVLGNTAWVVTGGKKARVFKSTDLGNTWNVYETPIIQGVSTQGIYSVDFANEKNGIVIGGDYSKPDDNKQNVAITKDGGITWRLVADGVEPNYKSCVKYVPNTNGEEIFAVGKTGVSYSSDNGNTWKKVSDESYYAIEFVDKNNAWLSGNQQIGKLHLDD